MRIILGMLFKLAPSRKITFCPTCRVGKFVLSFQYLLEITLKRALGFVILAGCRSVLKRTATDEIYTRVPSGIMATSDPPLRPEAANDIAGCSVLSFLRSH